METQEKLHKESTCKNCKNKESLIHKYLNLIELLKRKADKAHLSMTQKISIGDRTTSNSSILNVWKVSKHKLIMALHTIFLKRQNQVFKALKINCNQDSCRKAAKFFLILSNLQKKRYIQSFNVLKQINQKTNSSQIYKKNEQTIENNLLVQQNKAHLTQTYPNKRQQQSAYQVWMKAISSQKDQKKLSQHFKSLTNILLTSKENDRINEVEQQNLKNQSQLQNQSVPTLVSKYSKQQSINIKILYKKIFFLQQENCLYEEKIKKLQKQIQDANIRQQKQNKKKKQSLQMLAQDLAQKNQIILELQQNITILQQKYQHFGNVILEDELTSLKKQVDKFQKLNQKLDAESTKIKAKLSQVQLQLKSKNEIIFKIQEQNRSIKQKNFQLHEKNQQLLKSEANCQKIHNMIMQSLQKFKTFQKTFISAFKKEKIQEMVNIQNQQKKQEQNYKVELILIYLYNIQQENYQFPFANIFDQEQFNVLKDIKKKYLEAFSSKIQKEKQLNENNELKFKTKKIVNFNHHGKSHEHFQNAQEVFCNENMMDGTIFSVLNTPRDHLSGFNLSPQQNNTWKSDLPMKSGESSRHSPQKNMTMKLLQMQLQKNKQIQKISELKQKMMHIRNVILNLLKSLQIKVIKSETQGIMDVLFDVFEYSEQEKQQIFKPNRQKGIFGFFN